MTTPISLSTPPAECIAWVNIWNAYYAGNSYNQSLASATLRAYVATAQANGYMSTNWTAVALDGIPMISASYINALSLGQSESHAGTYRLSSLLVPGDPFLEWSIEGLSTVTRYGNGNVGNSWLQSRTELNAESVDVETYPPDCIAFIALPFGGFYSLSRGGISISTTTGITSLSVKLTPTITDGNTYTLRLVGSTTEPVLQSDVIAMPTLGPAFDVDGSTPTFYQDISAYLPATDTVPFYIWLVLEVDRVNDFSGIGFGDECKVLLDTLRVNGSDV